MFFFTRMMHWYRTHQEEQRREQQMKAHRRVIEEQRFAIRFHDSLERVYGTNMFNLSALNFDHKEEICNESFALEKMRRRLQENHTEIVQNREHYIGLLGLHTFNGYCGAYHNCMQALGRYEAKTRERSETGE